MSGKRKLEKSTNTDEKSVAPFSKERIGYIKALFTDDVLSKLASAYATCYSVDGWTKRDVAEICGVDEASISRIFSGRRKNLTIETVALLARGMNFRPELVLHDTRPVGNHRGNVANDAAYQTPVKVTHVNSKSFAASHINMRLIAKVETANAIAHSSVVYEGK